MKLPVLLRIYVNDKLEGVKQFTDAQIVIGSNADALLSLQDDQVSALHAVIEERENGYYISDLGSQAGTFRNGQKVLDEKLESGDELQIGRYRLQFFIGVPKPTAPPASAPSQQPVAAAPASSTPPPAAPAPAVAPSAPPVAPTAAPQASVPAATPTPAATPPQAPAAKVATSNLTATASVATPAKKQPPLPSTQPATVTTNGKPKMAARAVARVAEGTYAPPSKYTDLREVIKPGKGTVVEVIVAWKERILSSHHFSDKRVVTIGGVEGSDIVIPLLGVTKRSHPILRIDSMAVAIVTQEMSGEYIQENRAIPFSELVRQGKLRHGSHGFEADIGQGDMVRIGFMGNTISIYIRYVPEAPKPLVAPFLDLTASEVTGVILAIVVAAIFGLYMLIYSPSMLADENLLEEPIRKAKVVFNVPRPPKTEVIKLDDHKQEQQTAKTVDKEVKDKPAAQSPKTKEEPGKAAEVKPKQTPEKKQTLTSARPGGAVKTGPKDGASAKSEKVDPTKAGLLGAFGKKGTQSKLDQVYSGAGELAGAADSATGAAGFSEDRAGDTLGTKLKDSGAGGKGKASIGIAGVGVQGRGSGNYGYGTGGIGTKGSVDINIAGQEAEFEGTIDREAIRRVIRDNLRQIKACYERALNRNPDLYGKIVIEWDIVAEGRVARASVVSNSLGSSQVADCLIGRLKGWKFPDPPADSVANVRYPFVFSAQ